MLEVRGNRHHLGVTQAHELGVHHEVAHPDVCKQPTVPVTRLNVQLESYVAAADEATVHRRRLTTAGLFTSGRMPYLWRVDADVADCLHALAKLHVDGVAVHDAQDDALGPLAVGCRGQKHR
jgi:hypothetical protein